MSTTLSIVASDGFVGAWRGDDEDNPNVLTITKMGTGHLQIMLHDANDGEILHLSNAKATKNTIEYSYWVPSTGYCGRQHVRLRKDGTLSGHYYIIHPAEIWLRECPAMSEERYVKVNKTHTIVSFLAPCVGDAPYVGIWKTEDESTMRFSVKKVPQNQLRIRLYDVFFRGRGKVSGVKITAKTICFKGLGHSSDTQVILHFTLQKDGTLVNRTTWFRTWTKVVE